jgi:hypothetical protein
MAVALICASSHVQGRLNGQREKLGLLKTTTLTESQQKERPLLALVTVAMGGFRGLIANALWIRANTLQEEEKFYEMVQLSDWITALEPHVAQVWTHEAWNMAFNISVKFKDPEDRWRWVERGITLLRDRGIPLNPDSPMMYREISWLFEFKIGQLLDDAHMHYKLRWAQEMQDVLGARPDIEALEHPKTAAEKERAQKLRQVYKMDPEIIKKVDDEYGPFDWRMPDAHAVYWAEMYRQKAKFDDTSTNSMFPTAKSYHDDAKGFPADMLRRSIFQTLRQDCFRGSLPPSVTNVTEQNFMLWPNLDLIPKVSATYEKMIAEQPNVRFQNAHKNFIKEMIPLLFINGRTADAGYWFNYVKKTYTNAFSDKPPGISLQDYVVSVVTDDDSAADMNRVQGNVAGFFIREFVYYSRDMDAEAKNYENMGKAVWNHYHQVIGSRQGNKERLSLRPWQEIQQRAEDYVLDPGCPLLAPYEKNYLRSKLGLKAPAATETKPPASAAASAPAGATATQ